jgi:hypothetical protein
MKKKTSTKKVPIKKAQDGIEMNGSVGWPTDAQFVKNPNVGSYKAYMDFYNKGELEPGYVKNPPEWSSEKAYNESLNSRKQRVNEELKANSYWPYEKENAPKDWQPKDKLKKGGAVIKGSQLRRQGTTNGLRTSKKHK